MINPHIVRKTTDPVAAPPEAGIHWINTVTNKEFFSVGTSTVDDWLPRESQGVWLSGVGAPTPSIANEKDYYHDTDTDNFYKKLSGNWILFGVVNHSNLGELTEDNHPQYHTNARGDIRYYTKVQLDAGQLDVRYYTESEIDVMLSDMAVSLVNLNDVSIDTPLNNQTLLYNDLSFLWENKDIPVHSYTPAKASDWNPSPVDVVEALDQLATRADSAYSRVVPVDLGSLEISNNTRHLFLDTNTNLTYYSITMPSSPQDGLEITISSGGYGINQIELVPNVSQGFYTHSTVIRVPANSFVTYRWMSGAISKWVLTNMSIFMSQFTNGFISEEKTLSMQNIVDSQVLLSRIPAVASIVKVLPDGGISQRYGIDYAVVGDILTWNGLGLADVLEEGDILYITY